jgi:gas vesicle protein
MPIHLNDKNEKVMDNSKVLWGFLGGLAIGAIAGILLAPEKGSETRKNLKKMASDVSDAVEESLHSAMDKVKEKYADAMQEGEEFVERAAEKMGDARSGLSSKLS